MFLQPACMLRLFGYSGMCVWAYLLHLTGVPRNGGTATQV